MKIKIIFLLIILLFSPHTGITETDEIDLQPPKYSRSFGSILPITGKYSLLGERSLRGIRTAIQHAAQFGQYHVFVKDSKSTAEGAAAAYKKLWRAVVKKKPSFLSRHAPEERANSRHRVDDERCVIGRTGTIAI